MSSFGYGRFRNEENTLPSALEHDRALVEELRQLVSLNEYRHGGPYGGYAAERCMDAMRHAARRLESLISEAEDGK